MVRHLAGIALVGFFLATGVFAQQPEVTTKEPPATLALLVGINTYAGKEDAPSPLKGTKNDVDRVERLLLDRFGFEAKTIVKLVDAEATHEAIVRTIHRHLIEQAGPKTQVVFWFSGHGSRIPDASGHDPSPRSFAEPAMDQTLVAYDSRFVDPYGGYDITDDELYSLFAALQSKNVVIVSDCCHSGGALRGATESAVRQCNPGTRELDRERIAKFWPNTVRFRDDDDGAALSSVVHLSACGSQQLAGEHRTALGWFGTMTWFLTTTLREIDAKASWQEVAQRTRARVAGYGSIPSQLVEIEGDATRGVFGGRGRPVPLGYPVDGFGRGQFVVAAGRIHGIGEGAVLRLIGPTGEDLGTAEAKRVKTSSCIAEWRGQGRAPGGAIWAMPKTFGNATPPLRIAVVGADRTVLEDCAVVEIVADQKQADYSLREVRGRTGLVDSDGRLVRWIPKQRADAHLTLFREHCFRSLWQGVALPGMFQVGLAVEPVDAAESKRLELPAATLRGSFVSAAVLDPVKQSGGGLVKLVITNHSDDDLHIVVLSLCENREVNVVFGGNTRANNVIGAHKKQSKTVWLGPHPDWPADRSMIDRYVAIATSAHADFKPFESTAELTALRSGGDVSMPSFLQAALGGARTRGTDTTTKHPWGVAFLDLHVVRLKTFAKRR